MSINGRTNRSRGTENETVLPQARISRAKKRVLSLVKNISVENLAVNSDSGLLKLTQHRKWLFPAFVCGVIATVVVWITALYFPYATSRILSGGFDSNSTLLTILVMSIPFAPPFVSTFALGNMLFPERKSEISSGVMAGFNYTQESNNRWQIAVAAGVSGGLNCLLLVIALLSLTGN